MFVYNVDIKFCSLLFTKHISGDLIEKDEMGGAYDIYGGEERSL